MQRSKQELVRAMYKIAGKDAETLELTAHFAKNAKECVWTASKVLPKKDETVGFDDASLVGDEFLLMLVDSSVMGERHDPIFWMARAVNHATESSCAMTFIDGRECHPDWVGFKAISDYAFMRERVHVTEVVSIMEQAQPDLTEEGLRDLLQTSMDHLSRRRRRMLFRLLNDRLKGRIAIKVDALKPMENAEATKAANRITQDVYDFLGHVWPDAASKDEQRARTEVVQLACLGGIQSKLPQLTPC